MTVRKILLLIFTMSLFVAAPFASAEKTVKASQPKVIYARTAVGEIHSIDMNARTAVIGGYRYQFGSPIYSDTSKISLYGYSFGSFEMLRVGMKVYVRYAEYGVSRYVVSLKELAPDTDIHKRGVKVDP